MKGNARIKSVSLGYEDHGIMTSYLILEQGSSGQGFGGYRLDAHKKQSVAGTFWIKRVLETVGVTDWSQLVGKYIRVEGEDFGDITGIGHIVEDKWFFPAKEFQEIKDQI